MPASSSSEAYVPSESSGSEYESSSDSPYARSESSLGTADSTEESTSRWSRIQVSPWYWVVRNDVELYHAFWDPVEVRWQYWQINMRGQWEPYWVIESC